MKKRIPAHGIATGPSSLCSGGLRNRLGGLEHIHVLNQRQGRRRRSEEVRPGVLECNEEYAWTERERKAWRQYAG